MQAESGSQGPGNGGNGFGWFTARWLSRDEIMRTLRVEVAVYQTLFPRAKLTDRKWNYATFERGFWLWRQKDMIFVQMTGQVDLISVSLRSLKKRNGDAQKDT